MVYIDILNVYIDYKNRISTFRVNNFIIESKLLFSQKYKFLNQFSLNPAASPSVFALYQITTGKKWYIRLL